MRNFVLAAVALSTLSFTAMGGPSQTSNSDAAKKIHTAMQTMNEQMSSASMTGNVDHDFVSMMIPHHQGAIDMAKAYLAAGTDPAIRKMAGQIVKDQEREIGRMQAWLKLHAASDAH